MREQWLIHDYYDHVGEPASLTVSVDDIDSLDRQLSVHYTTRFSKLFNANTALNYEDNASWIKGFEFQGARLSSHYTLNTSDLWSSIETGPGVKLVSRFGSLNRSYRVSGGKVQVETELTMPRQRIELSDIKDFNRFIDLVTNEAAFRVWGQTDR